MTTLLNIELTCPICRKTFESQTILPAETPRRKRTDFHEEAEGVQSLAYLVHSCPTCGFSAGDRDFPGATHVDPGLVARVWEQLTPKLTDRPLTGSEKHEFAAKIAEWRGAERIQIADLMLRAAWCCVEEDDTEAERYFRRKAVRAFVELLAQPDAVDADDRAVLVYLVGELWRRIGDEKAAAAWFNRVTSEIVAPVRQRWIVQAARQQRDDPREWFDER